MNRSPDPLFSPKRHMVIISSLRKRPLRMTYNRDHPMIYTSEDVRGNTPVVMNRLQQLKLLQLLFLLVMRGKIASKM